MMTVFLIVLLLASVILGLIVLIQNPKGGGLSGNISGISSQFMGVKQTTDVLEKGTWIFAAIIGVLCVTSSLFISAKGGSNSIEKVTTAPASSTPQKPASPFGTQSPATTPPDSTR